MSDQNAEDQIDQKELAPGVLLIKEYKKVENDPPDNVGIFTFKVQLKTMNVVDFEVYLDQSENIELENKEGDELRTKNTIMPFETKIVAKVILKDNWKLKSKFKLTMGIPEKSIQQKYIKEDYENLEKNLQKSKQLLNKIPFEFLSQEEIETHLKNLNTKFIDIDFPPNDNAVINNKYDENLKNYLEYLIHWRTPPEFLKTEGESIDNIKLFNDDKEPEPNDIRQGLIPCNHLDSAISALAEKYNLIKRLFKTEKYNDNGIYQIKLCVNGVWLIVVIDNYFPCIPLSSPLVTRSQSSELWILVLEKALAKVFDCYYNLTCANISDFFMTLTGCPSLLFNIDDFQNNDEKNKLFNQLKEYVIEKKYLAVAISKMNENEIDDNKNDDDNSLTVPNFGYTIIGVKTKYKPKLIVLRKVWYDEKKESNIENYLNKLVNEYPKIMSEINDSNLVITFDDFLKEFSSFAVCFTKNWEEVHLRGKFVKNNEEVISKWNYFINLEKQTNLIISIFQDEDKFKENDSRKNLIDISLSVLKFDMEKNELVHVQTYDYSLISNLQIEYNLPKGQYIIIPRTSGCFFGKPSINIIKNNIENGSNNNNGGNNTIFYNIETKSFSNVFINAVKDIFKKFDILLNRFLSYEEFIAFLECAKNCSISENFSKKDYEELLTNYQSFNNCITEHGFIEYFKDNYLKQDGDKEIKKWFENLGYDNDLYALKSRCFNLTFHSDIVINVSARDALRSNLTSKINKLIIKTMGEKIKNIGDISIIRYQSKFNNIFSFGCINEGEIGYRVVLTFKNKENNIYSEGKNSIEKIVQSKKCEFLMNLFPSSNDLSTCLEFDAEAYPLN